MAKELDDCTPHDLYLEIRSVDCTQERAHEIKRYAYKSWENAIDQDDFSDEEWGLLLGKIEDLWGDYEYWHTYDRRGF